MFAIVWCAVWGIVMLLCALFSKETGYKIYYSILTSINYICLLIGIIQYLKK